MAVGGVGIHYARAQTPPAIVPSQRMLGAALDELRFKNRVDSHHSMDIAAPSKPPSSPTRLGPLSTLSSEEASREACLIEPGCHMVADFSA